MNLPIDPQPLLSGHALLNTLTMPHAAADLMMLGRMQKCCSTPAAYLPCGTHQHAVHEQIQLSLTQEFKMESS